MGAEAATGADLDDGSVHAETAGVHGKGLGSACHEQGRETADDETCELHSDSFVLMDAAYGPCPGVKSLSDPDLGRSVHLARQGRSERTT